MLTESVSTLGISTKERVISRVSFYVGVILVARVLGATSPSESDLLVSQDEHLGVAKVYIAAPAGVYVPQGR